MSNHDHLQGSIALVTGGAGFIGSNLVRQLVDLGCMVRVVDNLSNGLIENLELSETIDLWNVDIRDFDDLVRPFEGVDLVFHLAALGSVPRSLAQPRPTYEVNVLGSVNVFEAARQAGVTRVVYASSSSVYGDSASDVKAEGSEGLPISPYAASKAGMELIARVHSAAYGTDIVGLRFFNVFGPHQRADAQYAAVVPLFVRALVTEKAPVIYGDGQQVRDFTFVDDVVQALLLAAGSPDSFAGEAYNVSAGRPLSVLELFELSKAATGATRAEPTFLPARQGDIRTSRADITQAMIRLDFEPSWTVEDGLKEYVAWASTQAWCP